MKMYYMMACALVAAWSAQASSDAAKTQRDLGRVMYIGDSITHGIGAPSYRLALHKIFVDNDVTYRPVGVETGNNARFAGGITPEESEYRGVSFENVHSAMSSQRAYETSGRSHPSQRLDGTDIFDWLGLDKSYNGPRKITGAAPDTCFILLGTNDTLSDYGPKGGIAKHMPEVQKALTDKKDGDLNVIIQAIRQANPKAKIVLLPIPAWGDTRMNNTPEDYAAVAKYNKELPKKIKKVIFADVNVGLVDIACEERPGRGVISFYRSAPEDKLHPTRQGDLIIAGHVARSLGVPGRTVGLERKAASQLAFTAAALLEKAEGIEWRESGFSLPAGQRLELPWPSGAAAGSGFTVECSAQVGDGATGGWEKEKGLSLTLSDGEHSGRLTLSESYVLWNGATTLYPLDMSKSHEPIRVAWLPGDADQHIPGGFYVWLGDMLIGEALPGDATPAPSGVTLENDSARAVSVRTLAADAAPYAPPAPAGKKKAK